MDRITDTTSLQRLFWTHRTNPVLAKVPTHTHTRGRGRRRGFTLIELLVVISIIALLVGILLPALGAARKTAQNSQCLSNIRQMDTAAMSFAADHQFFIQISSTDRQWTSFPSELRGKQARLKGSPTRVKDWASAIVPYMGGDPSDDFENTNTKVSKAFICPSDGNQEATPSGYALWNNITDATTKLIKPISYGINADATTFDHPVFGPDWAGFRVIPYKGKATNGSLDSIRSTSNTMIYADCGTRKNNGSNVVQSGNHLMYTATTAAGGFSSSDLINSGTLAIVDMNSSASARIPLSKNDTPEGPGDRHGDKINVAFADGHAASFAPGSFNEVFLSPHR
jgi:prepilin-type N-terminal cleavage/methylation domain-containing protein/prepilin-type processing-associated H-X9-DG protein